MNLHAFPQNSPCIITGQLTTAFTHLYPNVRHINVSPVLCIDPICEYDHSQFLYSFCSILLMCKYLAVVYFKIQKYAAQVIVMNNTYYCWNMIRPSVIFQDWCKLVTWTSTCDFKKNQTVMWYYNILLLISHLRV